MSYSIAPVRGVKTVDKPWQGDCKRKPWEYNITAVIPVMDTSDTLELCIELLRYQTERPFIMVMDTGSNEEEFKKICSFRDEDVEVHSIRMNGTTHPSDFPAIAMDSAFSLCRTNYLFATHADVFLRRRNFLEDCLQICKEEAPVVGYEMSPRAHSDWKGMISHTASLYHMPTMDKIGFGWSLRRLANIYGIRDYTPNPMFPNWPDTEILGNYILRYYKIKTHIIGPEKNMCRGLDDNIDHCRSITSGRLYSPAYVEKSNGWLSTAKKEALERIENWKKESDRKNEKMNESS
jgi:hypothetical protein